MCATEPEAAIGRRVARVEHVAQLATWWSTPTFDLARLLSALLEDCVAMTEVFDDNSLAAIELAIDEWLARAQVANPTIEAVDRGEASDPARRWFIRMRGEEKEFTTIWLVLSQRTLQYETYVMPAPEENAAELFEHLLRRNEKLVGVHFSIGSEDAVFLRGEMPLVMLTEAELDRVIGTMYATVERCFGPAIRIGFRSRFADG